MTTAVILVSTILCGIFGVVFVKKTFEQNYKSCFIFKGLASLCFVIAGLIGLLMSNLPASSWLIYLGLMLGLVGDQYLAMRYLVSRTEHMTMFKRGTLSFMLGHVCYIIALLLIGGFRIFIPAIPYLVIGFILAYIYDLKLNDVSESAMKKSGYLYVGLVILMAACAFGCAIYLKGTSSILFAIGGFLFAVSDVVLIANTFGNNYKNYRHAVVHATYWPAQLLIAYSLFFM